MTATHPSGARLASVDILRALTMLLMIFVNDLWTLKGIPDWLEHVSAKADGLGFADTIFPAFLFITGMSVPLAIQQRQKKGDSTGQIFWHIGKRFLALIIMGLWLVNGEYLNEAAAGIKRISWNVLCCTSFVLLWNDWPKTWKPLTLWIMRIIAMGVLAFLVTQRRREIGIRLALGSSTRAVFDLVLREGLLLLGVGFVAGAAGAFLLRSSLESQLFGVKAADPLVIGAAAALLAVVALVACTLPARRATRIDPRMVLE